MDIKSFTDAACKELGLAPHKVYVIEPEIPGLKKGTANVFINHLTNTILVTPKAAATLTNDELCAVITHELGHQYNHHFAEKVLVQGVHLILSGINLFLPLPIWKKLLIEVGLSVAEIAVNYKLYHAQEFEADEMSFRFRLNHVLASALRKLDAENKKFMPSNRILAAMTGLTHPSTDERVKRLNAPVINR